MISECGGCERVLSICTPWEGHGISRYHRPHRPRASVSATQQNEEGDVVETPDELCRHVAANLAAAEAAFGEDVEATEAQFYEAMSGLDFLPSSPILMRWSVRSVIRTSMSSLSNPGSSAVRTDYSSVSWRSTSTDDAAGINSDASSSQLRAMWSKFSCICSKSRLSSVNGFGDFDIFGVTYAACPEVRFLTSHGVRIAGGLYGVQEAVLRTSQSPVRFNPI